MIYVVTATTPTGSTLRVRFAGEHGLRVGTLVELVRVEGESALVLIGHDEIASVPVDCLIQATDN